MITPRTTGIMGVHVWGRPCAIEALSEIASRRGLKLMFDAAHAFGNSIQRPDDRQLRRRGGLQLPRYQVLQHLRGRRSGDQRR